ncbi:hypothetical protein PAMP_002401 [Pampus punctatissimus]
MTREEDLIRIAKKLDKMVSRNNTDGAMDLLKELKGFNMTLKLLQETRIGMSVNSIRKHCTDEEVIALAKVLIKDWKRLLDSGHSHTEKGAEMRNGLDSSKTAASPNSSPSETKSSHRRLDVKPKHDSDPDRNHSDKIRKEKHDSEHKNKKRHTDDPRDEKHLDGNEKHPQEIRKEKQLEEAKKPRAAEDPQLETDNKKQKHDFQSEKHKPEPGKEKTLEEPKKMRQVEELKKEKHLEEVRKHSYADDMKKDKHKEESRHEKLINTPRPLSEPQREKPANAHKPIFERKDSKDSSSGHPRPHAPQPASPPARRPSLEVKKERKVPPDPNAPIAPLPLHLHPPPRKESSDSKPPLQKKTSDHVKNDRKDSSDSKVSKKHSVEAKKERLESHECENACLAERFI